MCKSCAVGFVRLVVSPAKYGKCSFPCKEMPISVPSLARIYSSSLQLGYGSAHQQFPGNIYREWNTMKQTLMFLEPKFKKKSIVLSK